jgi:hypothetical protein
MPKLDAFVIFLMVVFLTGCDRSDLTPVPSSSELKLEYTQMLEYPPCFNTFRPSYQCVIRSEMEYDTLKIKYAPQGQYEYFTANGVQKNFRLSYQPLDVNYDGKIDASELAIYLTGETLYVQYQGNKVKVHSNPFRIYNDSILIFNDTTYGESGKIPRGLVFDVDSITGEIKFLSPPRAGDQISICGDKELYSNYNGRDCDMSYYDFSKYSIIGIGVSGNGCLTGLSDQPYINVETKQIIIKYKRIVNSTSGGCKDIAVYLSSWIQIPKVPDDYSVVFQEKQ